MTPGRLERLRAEIAERGLRLEPFGQAGHRVHGQGVDLLVCDLSWVKSSDLKPIPAQGAGELGLMELRLQYQR